MDINKLWKLTGIVCLAFGIYSIILAMWVILFDAGDFFMIVVYIYLAFGILYVISGISILRKGKLGFFSFFGMFGSTLLWGGHLPWYIWPMIFMPIIILILFILVFFSSLSWQPE